MTETQTQAPADEQVRRGDEPITMSGGRAAGWTFSLRDGIEVPCGKPEPQWRLEQGTGPAGEVGLWLWCYPGKGAPRPVWRVPVVVARVRQRDGEGRPCGLLYLVAADEAPDSPRELVSEYAITSGRAGFGVDLPTPSDHALRALIGTALVVQPCPTTTEQIPRVDASTGRYPTLDPDVLPAGYGELAGEDEAAALQDWRELAPVISLHPKIALVLGMCAMSPFISPLMRQPRLLNLTGEGRRGKTTTLYLGASVWGNPGWLGGRRIVQSWNASAQGLPQYLGRLGILLGVFDEQGAGDPQAAKLMQAVYAMVDGSSRRLGSVDSLGRATAGWAGLILSSSNASMLDRIQTAGAGAGIPARLIEIRTPFTSGADTASALDALARRGYGHVGHAILARFAASDVDALIKWAAQFVPIPEDAAVSRTIRQHWHDAIAGAVMLDTVIGSGSLIQDAAIRAARELAEELAEPEHDAEVFLADLRSRVLRDPAAWPTITTYREWLKPRPSYAMGTTEPGRHELPQHGVRDVQGWVYEDDGYVAIPRGTWQTIMDELRTDSRMVCEWLSAKGLLIVTEAARRDGRWYGKIKPDGKKDETVYRISLSDPEPDQVPETEAPPIPAPVPPLPSGIAPAPVPASRAMFEALMADMRDAPTLERLEGTVRDVLDLKAVPDYGIGEAELSELRAEYARRRTELTPAPTPALPAPRSATETAPEAGTVAQSPAPRRRTSRRPARATLAFLAGICLDLAGESLAADTEDIAPAPATVAGLMGLITEQGPRMHVPAIAPGGQGSDGMIVLTPAAAGALGLDGKDWTKGLSEPAGALGLKVGRPGPVHVKLWRNGSGEDGPAPLSVTVVNMAAFEALSAAEDRAALKRVDLWAHYATTPDGALSGPQLARLVRAEAASALGDVPLAASSGAGMRLLSEVHPREVWTMGPDGKRTKTVRPDALPDSPAPAPVAAGSRHPMTRAWLRSGKPVCEDEDYRTWARELTPEEAAMPYAIAVDRNLAFLAGARDLKVPVEMLEEVDGYRGRGLFLADLRGLPVEADLPHFATAHGFEPAGPTYYSNETINYAAKQYGYDVSQISHGFATSQDSAIFTGFSDRVRDAYLAAMAEAGVQSDATGQEFLDQLAAAAGDGLILAKGRKMRYKGAFGRFSDNGTYLRDDATWLRDVASLPTYRPDVRYFVTSGARIGTHRMLATARALSGRAPIGLDVDCVFYAAPSTSPLELATYAANGRASGIRLGIRPGYCKPAAVIPMDAFLSAPEQRLSLNKLTKMYDLTGAPATEDQGDDDAE